MRIIDAPQGTPEWLASRAGVATASCFAAIMATGRGGAESADRRNYRSRLVVERLTSKPVQTFQSAAMKQGTEREPFARMAYETHTGNIVREVGLCMHDTLTAGASPDGLIAEDGGLEIKCPELSNHLAYLQIKTEPAEYTWQIQGAMWITGRAWWDFASYNPDFPERLQLVVRRVERDDAAIKKLAAEVERFLSEVDAEVERVRALKVAA